MLQKTENQHHAKSAVVHHVSEFCDLTKKGHSPWSEQTAESLHDFNEIWTSFKVNDC